MSGQLLFFCICIFLVIGAHGAPAAKPKPAAKPAPAKPVAKKGTDLTFNYGTLAVRPGCFLQALGKTKLVYEAHGPCGDQDDQDTWSRAVKMWAAAGSTWVNMCTKKGKQTMAKGCPPTRASFIDTVAYKAGASKWVQHWLNNPAKYTGIKGAFGGATLDIRRNKLILSKSTLAFVDGFLYVAQSGILGLEKSVVYVEDNPGTGLGAAVMLDDGKVGLVGGQFTLNNSIFTMEKSKFYLTQGANFKLIKGGFIMKQSAFLSNSGKMEFWDSNDIHIVRSVLNLTNTVVDAVRSNIYMWDSILVLNGAQVNLNMSRLLLSNVEIRGDGYVESNVGISDSFGVTVGSPVDAMNVDFKVEADFGKIVLTADKKEKEQQIRTDAGHGRR